MKKASILFSTLLIGLSLAACGSNKEKDHKDTKPKTEKVTNKLPKHRDVNDFADKHGKTPAAYLHDEKKVSVKKALQVLPSKDKTPQEKQTQQILENPKQYKNQSAPAPVQSSTNTTNNSTNNNQNSSTVNPDNNSNVDALNIYKHPEIYSNRGF